MDQDRHRKLRVAIQEIVQSVQQLGDTDPGPSSQERLIRGTATLEPRQVGRTRLRRWIPLTLILFVVGTMAAFSLRASLKYTREELAPPEVQAHASLKSVAPAASSTPVEPLAAPEQIATSSSAPVKREELRAHSGEPEQTTVGEPGRLASETWGVSALTFAERFAESPLLTLPSDAGHTETTALAKSVPATPLDPKGGFFVQVAAHRTEEHAQTQVKVMQSKYPTILGSREPIIYRKDLGSKGIYWRTQLGPFASREDATRFCNGLKAAGGQCLVKRND